MHTNSKLDFKNEFGFEVYSDVDPTVIICVDGVEKYRETFSSGIKHFRTADFYHVYEDKQKSNIEIFFQGNKEVSNKYIKLNSIYINSKKIDHLAYYYFPDIDPKWITPEIQDRIYINNGGIFGWYGRIKYEIRTVLDANSHYIAGSDPDYAITRVLGFSNKNLIYQNNKNLRLNSPWYKKL